MDFSSVFLLSPRVIQLSLMRVNFDVYDKNTHIYVFCPHVFFKLQTVAGILIVVRPMHIPSFKRALLYYPGVIIKLMGQDPSFLLPYTDGLLLKDSLLKKKKKTTLNLVSQNLILGSLLCQQLHI